MTGRIRPVDMGPGVLDSYDTDHSHQRPDAVEWGNAMRYMREALQTRSGRFMPVADLPGHGWVNEVADLLMATPWRDEAGPRRFESGLARMLQRRWELAAAHGASEARFEIDIPGLSTLDIRMHEEDGSLRIEICCADPDAAAWMQQRATGLAADLVVRMGRSVVVSVGTAEEALTVRSDVGPRSGDAP